MFIHNLTTTTTIIIVIVDDQIDELLMNISYKVVD